MPDAIAAILGELSEINVERLPNASLDLLRTFLEKTIKAYADEAKADMRQRGSAQGGFVLLDHCLKWISDKVTAEGNKSIAGVLRKVRGGQLAQYVATTDHLNAVNHNHKVSATPDEVRTAWNAVKPLFGWMMTA